MIQQQVLSTNELSGKNLNIRVTNPFRDELSVYADEPVKEVEITDINGRIIIKGKGISFNTSSLLKGTYFIKIRMASGKTVSKKVIKN